MAKPRPEKKGERTPELRVLPMDLRVGDRLADETGEWEVVGRPFTTANGENAHVRVQRIDQPGTTDIRTWGAHERVTVRRPMNLPADLEAFVHDHRPHGELAGDATMPAWNGYLLTVACSRGVTFERWVTPEEADADLLCLARLN